MTHPTYDDYWQARNVPKDLDHVTHPVLDRRRLVRRAGFLRAVPDVSGARRRRTRRTRPRSSSARGCTAAGRAATATRSATSASVRRPPRSSAREIELPFFNFYLKDKGQAGPLAEAAVRVRDRREPVARRYDQWPPKDAAPRTSTCRRTAACRSRRRRDSIARPRSTSTSAIRASRCRTPPRSRPIEGHVFMVEDQRFVAGRPDVLVYETEPLTEDLTIAGPIDVNVNVATTGTDGDWVVKVIDVYPGDAPDPTPNPRQGANGRLSDAAGGRHPAREVPQQHERAGADGAESADDAPVHARRQVPHLPQAPPRDGAGPELVVPDLRSQPADLRRHLPREGRRLSEGGAPGVPLGRRCRRSSRCRWSLVFSRRNSHFAPSLSPPDA